MKVLEDFEEARALQVLLLYFASRFLLISINDAEFTDAYHLIGCSDGSESIDRLRRRSRGIKEIQS
jgi:hypothetical protein